MMKSLLSSWFSILASLGRTIVWKRGANRNRSIRRPTWETLEPRHLLTATSFGLEAVFNEHASIIDATSQSSVFSISNSLGTAEGEGGLTATAVAIDAVDDEAWAGTVATFQDSTPGITAFDFQATINWGDGTITGYGFESSSSQSSGTIVPLGGGNFAVRGSHTFATEADPIILVTIQRGQAASASAISVAKVHGAKPIFVSAGVTLGRVELTSVTLDQSYSYSNNFDEYGNYINSYNPPTSPSDFFVSVDWGDGTPLTSAEWVLDYGNWDYVNSDTPYRLLGSHTYASPGEYEIRTSIAPVNSRPSASSKLLEDGNNNYRQHRGFSVTQAKAFQQTLTAQPSTINCLNELTT